MGKIFAAIACQAAGMTDAQLTLCCDYFKALTAGSNAGARLVLDAAAYEDKIALWRLLQAIGETKKTPPVSS